jgi:hypothetical protein
MAMEANLYALWTKKQTAKGTPATAASSRRMVQVAGDFTTNREDGSERFSDYDRFGSMTDFVNTITGEGNPGIESHPAQLAYIFWLFFGGEAVTGAADPWTHTFTPSANGGFWSTWWVKVGGSVIRREKFNDCKMGGLTVEGSTGAKVVRATPTLLSLDPGEVFDAAGDPSVALPSDNPFLYTEGTGTFDIDGTIFEGQSQFSITWDEGLSPYYGDDVVPVDLVTGNASVGLAATILVDSEGHAKYNSLIYNTAAPTTGTKPVRALTALGSYEFTLTKDTAAGPVTPARDFHLTVPGVKWEPAAAIPPNPEGGAIELALGGSMRKVSGQPATEAVVRIGEAAFT